MLSQLEKKALIESCELNENITLNVKDNGKIFVYKSRFLDIDLKEKFIIIDMPSPETHGAKPVSKSEHFEIFFTYKNFRYLFPSQILEHTTFNMQGTVVHAARISIPVELQDGEKREYFRVSAAMRPHVIVKFNIFEKDSGTPIMSGPEENAPKDFQGHMIDISGGGFSLRAKPGEKQFPLEKGDVIDADFRLRKDMQNMEIRCEVRNKRRYKNTEILIWGVQFIEGEKNRQLKYYRNKIMRYVVERQREMLSR